MHHDIDRGIHGPCRHDFVCLGGDARGCQRAIDDASITGRANYDSATEAEMTSYLNAANTALMQKGGSAQAMAGLKNYQQQLDAATKAQQIRVGDSNVLKEKLNKGMQCVSSRK